MSNTLKQFLKKPGVVPTAVGVVSFSAGLGLGYLLARRQTVEYVPPEPKSKEVLDYEERVAEMGYVHIPTEEELALEREEKAIREVLIMEGTLEPGETLIEEDREAFRGNKPDPSTIQVDEEAAQNLPLEHREALEAQGFINRNIFVTNPENTSTIEFDYEEEGKHRTTTAPYVLHKDEFWSEESGYEQTTLTYYEGDDILVDQEEVPIYNYEKVVGPLKFGHGSGDPNVFHVRNDALEAEYEIIRDTGHYALEVLGLEVEEEAEKADLKHSTPRKFRSDD